MSVESAVGNKEETSRITVQWERGKAGQWGIGGMRNSRWTSRSGGRSRREGSTVGIASDECYNRNSGQ